MKRASPPSGRPGRPVRVADVAEAAGVSVATVSRTLNNKGRVDPELAARVRDAATRLGYRINGVARNLRRQDTQVWALIIPDINNPFYTAVARGVEDAAQEAGYSVLLGNTDEDEAKEQQYLEVAVQERVAGLILSPRSTTTDLSWFGGSGIPIVVVDRELDRPFDFVTASSYDGAVAATEHLLAQGWRRPACITRPSYAATAEQRRLGYLEVVRRHGLPELVGVVPFHDSGLDVITELMAGDHPPDSLLTVDSMLALGMISALKQLRKPIAAEVGLISFDDSAWAPVIEPPLSVIVQPAYEIGVAAAQLLIGRIRGEAPDGPQRRILDTTLIVRKSSGRSGR
ncbi:LacI family DNA-binding transcriptional regulator [Microlunatus sp. GCM10028923]|uniref:LacI family DNA-binding transcriptional regulator n=1 Tax=Microlunatus sp. GCM10028923 TaxID=3273400 RepID=UPI003608F082